MAGERRRDPGPSIRPRAARRGPLRSPRDRRPRRSGRSRLRRRPGPPRCRPRGRGSACPEARYSKSLKLRSWERAGWASRSRASACRCSARVVSRSSEPSSVTSTGRRSGRSNSARSSGCSGPAIAISSLPGGLRRARSEPRHALDQRRRVAPVAAEAARVEQRSCARRRADPRPLPSRRRPRVLSRGPRRWRSRPDRRSRAPRRSAAAGSLTQTTRSAAPSRRRSSRSSSRRWAPVGNGGRSGSKVQASRTSATQGTPASLQRVPDRVGRLRRRGREDAIERLARGGRPAPPGGRTAPRRPRAARGRSPCSSGCGLPL